MTTQPVENEVQPESTDPMLTGMNDIVINDETPPETVETEGQGAAAEVTETEQTGVAPETPPETPPEPDAAQLKQELEETTKQRDADRAELATARAAQEEGARQQAVRDEQQAHDDRMRQVDAEAAQDARSLQDQGYDPQAYAGLIENRKQARLNELTMEQKARQFGAWLTDIAVSAAELSAQHGVPVKDLMQFRSRDEMERHVSTSTASSKEITELKGGLEKANAEIAELKKGRAPAQNFDNGRSSGASTNHTALVDAYNRGDRSEPAVKAAEREMGIS